MSTEPNKTVVINLFGVPGAGKSTMALEIAAVLSRSGKRVELVQEFAKEKVWEESLGVLSDQHYVFAKQLRRLVRAHSPNKVDYIVTDSPIALSLIYGSKCSDAFKALVKEAHHQFKSVNILITRAHPYDAVGRLQTEEESDAMGYAIVELVNKLTGGKYLSVPSSWEAGSVVSHIQAFLGENEDKDSSTELPRVSKCTKLVVAISGKARSGKNSLAKSAGSNLCTFGLKVSEIAFASLVKDVARREYGWTGSKNGDGRALLDLIGKLLRKEDPDCLIKNVVSALTMRETQGDEVIFVTDVRFRKELEALRKLDGKYGLRVISVRVESNRAHIQNMPNKEQQQSIAETDLDNEQGWDFVIENNGTVDDYHKNIKALLKQWGNAGYVKLPGFARAYL